MNMAQKQLQRRCRQSSVRQVAAEINVTADFVFKVIAGKKLPGQKVLGYLGLEQYIGYRKIGKRKAAALPGRPRQATGKPIKGATQLGARSPAAGQPAPKRAWLNNRALTALLPPSKPV
jgi:hypothetical protein